ncbi:purine catabolism regulatory protein [Ruminiclostridium hungatei]|uniref:Purine catabolism regulatory protein n=1 Tax=Ruminiclostridium hungatei TaxID=48256 RepID=A0A1V4SID7_RUMHU|nr:PucR family transcriptional regulator [Ruminiclostridium hungatei]OPX43630.1 purine catabolism regulatory protein [Ruminiclostridium hungatei]
MGITLEWLLSSERLNNFKCIAGKEYTGNVVKSVNILDNPDVVKWIKRDEFVLTTGYIFKDDAALQRSIIRELRDAGCAGLGIKIKRFLNVIPPEMMEEANLVGLPLVEMPFYYSFSDVLNMVYEEINSQKLSDFEIQYKFLDRLTSLFFENKGIDHMVNELAIFLKRPVLLADMENTLISAGISPPYANLVLERGTHVLTESNISHISYFDSDKKASNIYKHISINGIDCRFLVLIMPDFRGSLYIFMEEGEAGLLQQGILEKAVHILSLEVARTTAGKAVPQHTYQDFFLDFLMSTNERPDDEIINLCDFFGFDYRSKKVCITIAFSECQNEYLKKQIIKELCQGIKEDVCKDKKVYICIGREMLAVFLFSGKNVGPVEAVAQAQEVALALYELIKGRLCYQLKIGISRCHDTVAAIRTAFKDCMDAYGINLTIKSDKPIYSYSTQTAYHLLKKVSFEELNKIYRDTVEPLSRYDSQNDAELFNTLQTYYKCKFNASETAKKMFLHRNTLMNRLEKIKDLINFNPDDYGMAYSYYLGICAYEILRNVT